MKYPDFTAGDGEYLLNLIGGWEKFQQLKTGALTLVVKSVNLPSEVTTISVPAVKLFVARDRFRADTSKDALVRISFLSDCFKQHFLGKGEENLPATTMALHKLLRDSADGPILTELGDRAETCLAHLWHLLSQQGHGQSGPLLIDGRWNIFYICDTNQKLWAVDVGWDVFAGGWSVSADSVGGPDGWGVGCQVASRK